MYKHMYVYTDAEESLNTLLVRYYIDLLGTKIFFLKIGILRAKVYTKKVPNIEECIFISAPLRSLYTKQVIVVPY